MKFDEIVHRLTGFSIPIFGVSWNPSEADVTIARRVITFLEDRRVLYSPYELEEPHHCVDSVIEIRRYLTDELMKMDSKNELAESLRTLRAACRKFLDRVGADEDIVRFGRKQNHWASWVFDDALGQMRGQFGIYIAILAAKYGLDAEDGLASIFPERDTDTQ